MGARKQASKKDVKATGGKNLKAKPKRVPIASSPTIIKKPTPPSAPLPPVERPSVKRSAGPSARTCPLVLDGEIDAADFSPSDCLTCGEFDCLYCEAAEGSGTLRSRLFAGTEGGQEDGEAGWGGDLDFDGGEEAGGDEEGAEEDLF